MDLGLDEGRETMLTATIYLVAGVCLGFVMGAMAFGALIAFQVRQEVRDEYREVLDEKVKELENHSRVFKELIESRRSQVTELRTAISSMDKLMTEKAEG